MAFDYNRNAGPGWGSTQYQFRLPPRLNFQPAQNWGGCDYYNAHSAINDGFYYNAVVDSLGNSQNGGVDLYQARRFHRNIYGGLTDITIALPSEIGPAAAFEAYRIWSMYKPMHPKPMPDLERQREGLVGIAIAEATRLWQNTGRPMDRVDSLAACEAAAATATVIFEQNIGNFQDLATAHAPAPISTPGPAIGPGVMAPPPGSPGLMDDVYARGRAPRMLRRVSALPGNATTRGMSPYSPAHDYDGGVAVIPPQDGVCYAGARGTYPTPNAGYASGGMGPASAHVGQGSSVARGSVARDIGYTAATGLGMAANHFAGAGNAMADVDPLREGHGYGGYGAGGSGASTYGAGTYGTSGYGAGRYGPGPYGPDGHGYRSGSYLGARPYGTNAYGGGTYSGASQDIQVQPGSTTVIPSRSRRHRHRRHSMSGYRY